MKKLFLVDVSSLFFRAFYAVRPLSTPAGVPVNAVYGFLSMLMKLLKDEKPEYLVFCYDRKDPSFRKEIYEDYKANRTEMPQDLVPQIPYIKKLAEVMGIPSLDVPSYEADDLIGTMTKIGLKNEMEIMIVSGDKDFGQLVEEHVYLVDTMKNTKLGPMGVKEKWGIPPAQFIDYLALVGDSSDNVPGVSGIGPKGAQKLLEEFGTLEGVYENLDKIKSDSLREKLSTGKDNAFLSRKLVTIVCDVKISENIDDYKRQEFHLKDLTELLGELNFKTLEKNIWNLNVGAPGMEASTVPSTESYEGKDSAGTETTSKKPAAKKASKKTKEAKENKSEDDNQEPLSAKVEEVILAPIFEISKAAQSLKAGQELWGFSDERGVYIGIDDQVYQLQGEIKDLGLISDELKLRWKGFDVKTFLHLIKAKHGNISWDSMIAAYVIKPGESMDFYRVYSRFTGDVLSDLPGPMDVYTAQKRLETELRERIKDWNAEKIYEKLDLPLVPVLLEMENRGVRLDTDLLAKQSAELAIEIKNLEKRIHELAGETFNVASPKQLSHVLFEKMKLPAGKKTKTGFSTDEEVLHKLKSKHEIAQNLIDYRELSKLKSTYVDSLPLLVKEDGRIHSTFNQALTTTGRLSSIDPNLQNIPIRTERGARVRKAFVADKGKVLLSVDYSQIELRILAHFSGDPNLTKAFKDDLDIHTATAAEVFSVPLKEVTSEQRRAAKAVNFGIAYGQGAFGLAENLGIPRNEASEIIKRYFEKFGRIKNYIEDTIKLAREQGFIETLAGRRRYIDELRSNSPAIQKFGERAAINAPIQGTAADIVKKAMIVIEREVPVPMLLQVHDELIFEGSEDEVKKWQPKIVSLMEEIIPLDVPLKANAAYGKDWDSAK